MNLLVENGTKPHRFTDSVFFRLILALVFLGGVVYVSLLLYERFSGSVLLSQQDFGSELEELNALYQQEALPPSPSGRGNYNYGLEKVSSSSIPLDGYVLYTGTLKGEKQETVKSLYFQDVTQQEMYPNALLPSYIPYAASVEVDTILAPRVFFADVSQLSLTVLPQNAAQLEHRVQKYDLNKGLLTGYASIEGEEINHLAWSEAAHTLAFNRFTAPTQSVADLAAIENWEIVLSDIQNDTVEVIIEDAFQPKWSADGRTIFMLKTDGLYVYDLEQRTQTRLVGVEEGTVHATSMFDVSHDGKRLIWTIKKAGVVIEYELINDAPSITLKEIGRLHVVGSMYDFPQFSPNSEYFVVRVTYTDDETSGHLEVRQFGAEPVLRTIPLDAFELSTFTLDTWTKSLPDILLTPS